jgi:hypothetical protein
MSDKLPIKTIADLQAAGALTDADLKALRSGDPDAVKKALIKFKAARAAQEGGVVSDADLKAMGKK